MKPESAEVDFLTGGGEMGARTRAYDWSKTPLGPVAAWPQSLKTAVSICLGSRHPICIWWSQEHLTQFYNDGFISFLGARKHPRALGQSARECWREIWHIIDPMLEGVFASGEATWSEDFLYVLDRHLPREEGYFTFSYSPIRDAGAIGGIFCACSETTGRVIGERRLRTLRDLSHMEVQLRADRACEVAAQALGDNLTDIPFSIIYLLDEKRRFAEPVATTGLEAGSPASTAAIDLDTDDAQASWPVARVLRTDTSELMSGLSEIRGALPAGPWPESSDAALIAPIPAPGQAPPTGALVCGLSPRRVFDADYRSFVNLVAGHIGTSVANARAYDEERKRAEALAELDRAKTAFFSNVSHEFRTPLTLMLGPLEEALADDAAPLQQSQRGRVEVAHRNSLRLLKLVNSLLDFSRIEAGRVQASYEPMELAQLTADLASNFRSATERAGLELVVDCTRLSEPVFIDRDMWEKIVLNLLSNAFKFTFEGEIAVAIRRVGDHAELSVRDTGVGISSNELPHLFKRFHRVAGQRSRTYEGSGIGLALVQELVNLHGGQIRVESEPDRGTMFTVDIPFGSGHLPQDRITAPRRLSSTSVQAAAYVGEALRWLPEAVEASGEISLRAEASAAGLEAGARVLLAEDNADMRAYVRRLLSPHWDVEAVPDGEAALKAIRARRPDLVLADVMMPQLDGFGLLRAIRDDPDLRELPVIMLSARAGEEARIEGLTGGADDYLTKPFSAQELLARVESHLKMARVRREATETLRESEGRFRRMADNAPVMVRVTEPDARSTYLSKSWYEFTGQTAETGLGFGWVDAVHPEDRAHAQDTFLAANEKCEAFRLEYRLRRRDGAYRWAIDAAAPRFGADGAFLGYIGSVIDITERKQQEQVKEVLIAELQHRTRNLLAVVGSISSQTREASHTLDDFGAKFQDRLAALSRVQGLLSLGEVQVSIGELVRQELAALGAPSTGDRIAIDGPDVSLPKDAVQIVLLALHELGTNALKYGALAADGGRLAVTWQVERGNGAGSRLLFQWAETGVDMTAVNPGDRRRGYGRELIENALPYQLDAKTRFMFGPDGIRCSITLPFDEPISGNGFDG